MNFKILHYRAMFYIRQCGIEILAFLAKRTLQKAYEGLKRDA